MHALMHTHIYKQYQGQRTIHAISVAHLNPTIPKIHNMGLKNYKKIGNPGVRGAGPLLLRHLGRQHAKNALESGGEPRSGELGSVGLVHYGFCQPPSRAP